MLNHTSRKHNKFLSNRILRWSVLICFIAVVSFSVWLLSWNCLFFETESGKSLWFFAQPGQQFKLQFIHSVERTLVVENFEISRHGGFVLKSTEYESFGVGLPFLAQDGKFRRVGDRFVMEDMNRLFNTVDFRTAPEAQLTLVFDGTNYSLQSVFGNGAKVHMRFGPLYSRWIKL